MLATAMIHGVSLDRHEPPAPGRVKRDARRTNGGAGPVRRVEAIDVPEHRLREALRKWFALNDAAADLTAPLG
jgi:hypothetical protein